MGCKKELPQEIEIIPCNHRDSTWRKSESKEVTIMPNTMLDFVHLHDYTTDIRQTIWFIGNKVVLREITPDGFNMIYICNFPNSAKRWKIPKQGIKVQLSGYSKTREGKQNNPHYQEFNLELVTLKIE
ncbi:hypothetical protein FACS1894201_05380 [Bacteroidia bacterium]|nr:hypothetical protein FACS1894201_05380 [Bacteroidia bacterium]